MSKVRKILLAPPVEFSYNQFFIYDPDVGIPRFRWTRAQHFQGFARQEQAISVITLLEFGIAQVIVIIDQSTFNVLAESFERAIELPLKITSGTLVVEGPEEYPITRSCEISPGDYRIIIGQRKIDEENEEVVLYLDKMSFPLEKSRILVADAALQPPEQLIEHAESLS